MKSLEGLIAGVLERDSRALSRVISLVENNTPEAREILAGLYKHTGHSHVVGVTGSPGAGKSTLVDKLAHELLRRGKSVAVLALDPSSPYTGGAILGDRIRMSELALEGDVYIRSMATRGALGGLSESAIDVAYILDAAKFDFILVETVGVGQGEVDIISLADTCLVVVIPGMGDAIQAIKAGILEIADIFVVNKCDRDGVDVLEKDLLSLTTDTAHAEECQENHNRWCTKVQKTIATQGEGIPALIDIIEEHRNWLSDFGQKDKRQSELLRRRILSLISNDFLDRIIAEKSVLLEEQLSCCLAKETDPYSVAKGILGSLDHFGMK